VLATKVIKIEDLQLLLSIVLKNANCIIKNLDGEKKKVVEKFIGLWFNMEDHKTSTLEA
jgi:hypothetical protein